MYISIENPLPDGASVGLEGSLEMSGLDPMTPSVKEVLSVWPTNANRRRQPLSSVPVIVSPQSFQDEPPEVEGALLVPMREDASEYSQQGVRVALRRPLQAGDRWLADLFPHRNMIAGNVAIFPLSRVRRGGNAG